MGRGKLTFKGETTEAKKKSSKAKFTNTESHSHLKRYVLDDVESHSAGASGRTETDSAAVVARSSAAIESPKVLHGTGTITVSGTVVTGYKTRFLRELNVGDAVIVTMNGNQPEMRVVTMRLSDTSLNLSSAFSQAVTSQPFQFINKPRNHVQEAHLARLKSVQEAKEEESKASGVYGATDELVYREKTEHGSYRIKRIKVEGDARAASGGLSRGELLEMRAKKKSDKYC